MNWAVVIDVFQSDCEAPTRLSLYSLSEGFIGCFEKDKKKKINCVSLYYCNFGMQIRIQSLITTPTQQSSGA
jgi:hypothetical protein